MKLTAAREELLAPLQSVIGVVERRQTMPVARERAGWRTGQQTKRHGERSRGRAGRNLHGERAAAGRYHGARPRISPKALACELGGNRLPQVQVNAPARRRVPASLRLRTSLRDPAAVRGTKRDADPVRHAVPGSLEPESSVLSPREVKSPALKPGQIHSPAQQSHCVERIQAHWRVKIGKSR